MRFLSLVLLLLGLAAPLASAQRIPSDKSLRRAWDKVDPDLKVEVAEYFRFEVSQLDLAKLRRVRFALELNEEDPGLFPSWEPPGYYDPKKHAPGMPIERKVLPESSAKLRETRKALLPTPLENALVSAYHYDYGTGRIYRTGDPDDPDALFENVLNGYAPDTDLARAALQRALDSGLVRNVLAAFGHTYTDLEGNVYEGITLYDAWRSGKDIFMPDVDVLGVVHDVLDDWDTWVSPVPDSQHKRLYARVGQLYVPARHFRELRVTLADLYFSSRPAHVGTYLSLYTGLHALWTEANDAPATLAALLPSDPARIPTFLKSVQQIGKKDKERYREGQKRQKELESDEKELKRTLVRVMRELEAL